MRVLFIGTGHIGEPMAGRLLEAGHDVVVNDLLREATEGLVERGATWTDSPAGEAGRPDAVCMSLPTPAAVESVALTVLPAMRAGATLIDLSTSPPALARRLASLCAEAGIGFLEAPVSGGQAGARRGRLSVMVGGDPVVLERCRSIFEAIGRHVYHVGEAGSGNVAKLVNNMLCFVHMWAAVEGITLGARAGVDPNVLRRIVSTSSGSSLVWGLGTEAMLKDELSSPTFTLDLCAKDLGLAMDLAEECGVPVAMGRAAHRLIEHYQQHGFGDRDIFSTVAALEERTGARVRGRWKEL